MTGRAEARAPAWFREALAVSSRDVPVRVDGVDIAVRRWGAPGPGRPVLLIHGGTANLHWWDHIAPALVEGNEVVALDLSGHGDSGWRSAYTTRRWADEVVAVAGTLTGAPPVVIGHSMGGVVAVEAAQRHGSAMESVVLLDVFLAGASQSPPASPHVPTLRAAATREEMVARFRLVPDAPALSYTRQHVAWHAIRPSDGQWRWKFDPRILTTSVLEQLKPAPAATPLRVIRGDSGDMPAESLERLEELAGPVGAVTTIEDAGHHLMLDRPLDLIEALRVEIRRGAQ